MSESDPSSKPLETQPATSASPASAPTASPRRSTIPPTTGRQPAIASATGKQPAIASATGKQAILVASASRPAARRKLMLELLGGCIEKSRVRDIVGMETIRFVLESSVAPKWRGQGDFEIEGIWKILSKEPGLSHQEAALPLLVFSTYEEDLGVPIKLPEELSVVSLEERMLLREGLGFGADELARAVERIKEIDAEEEAERDKAKIMTQATSQADAPRVPKKKLSRGRIVTIVSGIFAGALALVAAGGALFIIFSDGTNAFDVNDVGDLIQLSNGRRAGTAIVAEITDSKWEKLSVDAKKQLAHSVFERESSKGIDTVNLVDGTGKTLAYISAPGGGSLTIAIQ